MVMLEQKTFRFVFQCYTTRPLFPESFDFCFGIYPYVVITSKNRQKEANKISTTVIDTLS